MGGERRWGPRHSRHCRRRHVRWDSGRGPHQGIEDVDREWGSAGDDWVEGSVGADEPRPLWQIAIQSQREDGRARGHKMGGM